MNGFSGRAWECALVLLERHADRMTIQQHIACRVAVMAGPDRAPLGVIALACQVIGTRQ